MNYCNLRG